MSTEASNLGLLFTKDMATSALSPAMLSITDNHLLKSLSFKLAMARGERLNNARVRGILNLKTELRALRSKCRL
ncbi:MAG: hypothetical protein A4E23_00773 [Methanomethylovorans sp. PtaU1.Bin073]|nr:MAG: hypothetical protein A4E23_00773 [Methanomethylovorans sp. PtaU1.Bin073]